jgi:4,5-DOPA dioxygenase extradiol
LLYGGGINRRRTISLRNDTLMPAHDSIALPSLFISHGAPTFALEPGEAGPKLTALAGRIERPDAILLMSPHWQTRVVTLSAHPHPETIHDFGGFPAALYALRYPAPGAPKIAHAIAEDLRAQGIAVEIDPHRGFDHGAWVPLRYLYPNADIPVVQLSMPYSLNAKSAYALGAALRHWRSKNLLIIGSGSLTHNLYEFRAYANEPAAPYAREFVAWIREAIAAGDHHRIVSAPHTAPHARRAHPTDEHFLPLPFAAGAAGNEVDAEPIDAGFTYGVLSMQAFAFDRAALKPMNATIA